MNKKKTALIILVVFFGISILVGGWFYYSRVLTVNYLIPGVPYNGINNLFFSRANTSEISSILDILGYWGDKRFAVSDLGQKFPPAKKVTPTSTILKPEIQSFFTENGYETSGWLSVGRDNAIKEIKQFVNSQNKIPVIVLRRWTLDQKNNIFAFTAEVVIGIFDNSQKVIVHNHYYGNNYEISYDDFEKMFRIGGGSGILAVWPSDKIKGQIKEPNYELVYPQRLESMDKAGTLLTTKYLLALRLWRAGAFEQSVAVYKEFFDDPNFKYFPSAFQIVQLKNFARLYLYLNQPDEAIKIINEQVLPLNKNLSQTLQGWSGVSVDEFSSPYYVLSLAYLKEGKRDLAVDSYKKMKLISTSISEEVGEDNYLSPPPIEELEKAISKKK